jgi:pimeloyl-ACP methyl ester carboxylesterase
VQLAGRKIDVVTTPPLRDGAPTIVFLHEGLGSIALWRDFPARLRARTGYGTIVYSRYGNGFSEVLHEPRGVDYMHHEGLVALPELLAALHVDQPILFGHSDGASIALIYASAYPDRVRTLVLEAPHVIVEDISVRSIAGIGENYRTTSLREKMARYHSDVDATFFGWNDIWLAPSFRSWSIVEMLPAIRVPVLAIQGLDDEYGTPAQLDLLAANSGSPTDRLLLSGCGHTPHRDRAALVEGAAAGWIAEIAQPG